MRTYSANHKPLPEYDIDPGQIDAIEAAARRLPGVRRDRARNFGEFLRAAHGLSRLTVDDFADKSRTTYRRMLLELGAVPPPADGDKPPRMYVSDAASPMSFDDLLVAA